MKINSYWNKWGWEVNRVLVRCSEHMLNAVTGRSVRATKVRKRPKRDMH